MNHPEEYHLYDCTLKNYWSIRITPKINGHYLQKHQNNREKINNYGFF